MPQFKPVIAALVVLAAGMCASWIGAAVGADPVLAGVLVGVGLVAALVQRANARISRQWQAVDRRLDDVSAHIALESAIQSQRTAPPWSCWSLSPASILRVLSHIQSRGRTRVVECGSGMSTIYIAHQLRTLDEGHLWSVESDPGWAAATQVLIEERGLQGWATVVTAPLADLVVEGRVCRWYDRSALGAVLALQDVELLVVDGPPLASTPGARYPALPVLEPTLSPDALVVVDDGFRQDERDVVSRWCATGKWRSELLPIGNGLFELRRVKRGEGRP